MTLLGAVLLSCAALPQEPPANAQVRETLRTVRLSIDFREVPLSAALDYLRDATGLNMALDPRVDASRAVTLRVRDLPVRTVLKLILEPLDLGGVLRDGVLRIVPRVDALGALEVRLYDVRDLLASAPDFPAPRLDLNPRGVGPIWEFGPETEIREREIGDALIELVRACAGPGRWEGGADVVLMNGHLVVTQTRAAHREIARLLERLRMFQIRSN